MVIDRAKGGKRSEKKNLEALLEVLLISLRGQGNLEEAESKRASEGEGDGEGE